MREKGRCCRAVPPGARRRTKTEAVYPGPKFSAAGLAGRSPRREGRGGTAFGERGHRAGVSPGVMISEVIGPYCVHPKVGWVKDTSVLFLNKWATEESFYSYTAVWLVRP